MRDGYISQQTGKEYTFQNNGRDDCLNKTHYCPLEKMLNDGKKEKARNNSELEILVPYEFIENMTECTRDCQNKFAAATTINLYNMMQAEIYNDATFIEETRNGHAKDIVEMAKEYTISDSERFRIVFYEMLIDGELLGHKEILERMSNLTEEQISRYGEIKEEMISNPKHFEELEKKLKWKILPQDEINY